MSEDRLRCPASGVPFGFHGRFRIGWACPGLSSGQEEAVDGRRNLALSAGSGLGEPEFGEQMQRFTNEGSELFRGVTASVE